MDIDSHAGKTTPYILFRSADFFSYCASYFPETSCTCKSAEPPPDLANIGEPEPEESIKEDDATTTMHSQTESLVPPAISRQNELTPAEVQEVEKRLRVRTFLLCVYASIWGMGGHLVGEASRLMCSAFIRQVSQRCACSVIYSTCLQHILVVSKQPVTASLQCSRPPEMSVLRVGCCPRRSVLFVARSAVFLRTQAAY